jgi:Na+(H+)/acetate symporter ActP
VQERIAQQEPGHYEIWKRSTHRDVVLATLRIWFYYLIARIMGMTFAVRFMESIEKRSWRNDRALVGPVHRIQEILVNEENLERELIARIGEERLKCVGSIVLGLNDALVEFTGTLAGLTFAIQNTQIIAVAGLIMGVAASLLMGAINRRCREHQFDSKADAKEKFQCIHVTPDYLLEIKMWCAGCTACLLKEVSQ